MLTKNAILYMAIEDVQTINTGVNRFSVHRIVIVSKWFCFQSRVMAFYRDIAPDPPGGGGLRPRPSGRLEGEEGKAARRWRSASWGSSPLFDMTIVACV